MYVFPYLLILFLVYNISKLYIRICQCSIKNWKQMWNENMNNIFLFYVRGVFFITYFSLLEKFIFN